jgi:hypothetical protein
MCVSGGEYRLAALFGMSRPSEAWFGSLISGFALRTPDDLGAPVRSELLSRHRRSEADSLDACWRWQGSRSMTRLLLIVTAVFEAVTGLALMIWPSRVLMLLFGPATAAPLGPGGARVAGVVLFALGVACWFTRKHGLRPAGRRMVATMLSYNLAVAAVLAAAGIHYAPVGIALWPAVIAHCALAVWCAASLRQGAPAASG